ncbi:hypothetical protein BHM03_00050539 [Ensete ventricosum]|nr:hypothetical protein BHM03_00050539 [Ensete ventricosum]
MENYRGVGDGGTPGEDGEGVANRGASYLIDLEKSSSSSSSRRRPEEVSSSPPSAVRSFHALQATVGLVRDFKFERWVRLPPVTAR